MAEASRSTDETQAVRDAHRFDEGKLDDYLSANFEGFAGPLVVRQFPGGLSNPTYLLETRRTKYVLRRKPPGQLLKSAHAVDREFRVMSALHSVGFPVPRPYLLCADELVIGTMFFVMEHVPGRIFIKCAMPELSRDERAAIYDAMNDTLARLCRVDFKALGLEDYGRPGNYFARQVARWSAQYDQSKTQDIPEMDRLMEWLPKAIPPENPACIVHGDFSFHNVLFHPHEARVVAVVDWELSTLGDPFGDLTYHGMEWYRPGDGRPWDVARQRSRGSRCSDIRRLCAPLLRARRAARDPGFALLPCLQPLSCRSYRARRRGSGCRRKVSDRRGAGLAGTADRAGCLGRSRSGGRGVTSGNRMLA